MNTVICLIQVVYSLAIVVLSIPILVFFVQILFSMLSWQTRPIKKQRPSIAVLIPGHNEALGIAATLIAIKSQLLPGDRFLVVADNCSDETAAIATAHGAEVIERFDEVKRGKGYALDFGVRYLEHSPPEIVIIVDADCIVHEGALGRLAEECISFARPIQALYLMKSAPNPNLKAKIAEFAWVVRNLARPIGFHQLHLPCQLMGTGMAFPWKLLKNAELASGHIVEDMKLGMDCARQHQAPQFSPSALVTSNFPSSIEGVNSQRTRWEHGHLAMILKEGLPLLLEGIRRRNKHLFFMALDICVPPLAMLVLLILLLSVIGVAGALTTQYIYPWIFAWGLLSLMSMAVVLAWLKYAQHILSLANLMYAPVYILRKIPIYIKFFIKRQVEWVRSKRD